MGTSLKSEVAVEAREKFEADALAFATRVNTCVMLYTAADGSWHSLVTKINETPSAVDQLLRTVVGVSLYDINPTRSWALAFHPEGDLVVKGKGNLNVHLEAVFWLLLHSSEEEFDFH